MSKKRGLSLEEKREKMLQIFYESQDFFLLKELEKLGPKKGVISQSVKDVIQSLVDDDLVAKDKIGISIYFWSLPSCAGNQLRSVRQKLESDLQGSNKRLAELVDQCEALKKGREESEERTEALTQLKDIEKKHKDLKNEMVQFADNDPATLEAKRNAIEVAHQSANRWTDNIFTLRQWCSNNFPQAKEQLEHLYTEAGITDDFDYIELSSFPLSLSHEADTAKQLVATVCFISIDCGSPPNINYVDTDTGISYTWDAPFINAGVNVNVSEEYGYPKNPVLPFPLADVRSFPQGNRNCYTLTPSDGKGNLYLIRASFMYGNYDGKNALPEFDLYVNVNFWTSVKLRNASENVIKEILSFAESDTIYVCLVNKGKGTPFISALELRPMNSSIYGTEFGRNVSLVLYQRWDTGYLNGTGRYQKDTYDRIWSPYSPVSWNTTMTTGYIDIFQSGYRPPDEVIKTAASPKSDDEPLELSWTSSDPDTRFYAYLYFAELENLKRNESREIKIFWNGSPVSGAFNPSPEYSMTVSNSRAFTGKDHWISVQKTAESTRPPILNAIEIFSAQSLDEFYTRIDDVQAIESIKSTYKVNKIWTGDPCSPRLFPWEGIGCSYNTSSYQIKSLNLSSSGLHGPIAFAFRNLSLLESLDLSNNNLKGIVPEFLADLKYLKSLNLKGNNLTGFIPRSLRKRATANGLALSVDEQNICHSRSCRDGNRIMVPIVVSTLVIILIAALAIICIMRRESKIRAYSGPLLPSGKRRFTYSEVSSITNNFNKVIGKGGFGIVYLGSLEDGTEIAVKMINDSSFGKSKGSSSSSSSSQVSKEFQVECLAAELAREPKSNHEKKEVVKEKYTKTKSTVQNYSSNEYNSSSGSVSLSFGDYSTFGPMAR
ncbi:unnamed protein product [Arabidopsis thaliana]|uniref:(thale cress) hypothetical protein n=1 Tax=Arabidopsis thaliana TaxID=3702 RepID=A0A7G2F1G0_ARATH|nr:unnamed protein product [Arabidopsis thaliana]